MANLNKVFLIGRLTRDPELRYTPGGTAVCDFGLAVNREWTPKDGGEKRKETCFVDITAWQKVAEVIAEHLKKGREVFVEGRLQLDQWETDAGEKRSKLKLVLENFQFLGGQADGEKPSEPKEGPPPPRDEDVPF